MTAQMAGHDPHLTGADIDAVHDELHANGERAALALARKLARQRRAEAWERERAELARVQPELPWGERRDDS